MFIFFLRWTLALYTDKNIVQLVPVNETGSFRRAPQQETVAVRVQTKGRRRWSSSISWCRDRPHVSAHHQCAPVAAAAAAGLLELAALVTRSVVLCIAQLAEDRSLRCTNCRVQKKTKFASYKLLMMVAVDVSLFSRRSQSWRAAMNSPGIFTVHVYIHYIRMLHPPKCTFCLIE